MEFQELIKKAKEVKELYRRTNDNDGHKRWELAEYFQGLVGDVGDLSKLIMAKDNFRKADELDQKLKHELVDCLWSIMVIVDELNIDLEKEFLEGMDQLKKKLNQ